MTDDAPKLTPMFEQYARIKADYPDALLFYRMGDFYELFYEDAVIASRELQIALTSRNKTSNVPMCGVPWHSSRSYIAQLIDKGYVVAICEQVEDPKLAKGLVERKVTHLITPGTVLDDANLEAKSNNYLGCVCVDKDSHAFVWADLSTGKWTGAEFRKSDDLWEWVGKIAPRELLLAPDVKLPNRVFLTSVHVVHLQTRLLPLNRACEIVCRSQKVPSTTVLGLQKKPLLTCACAAMLQYFEQTQHCVIDQLDTFAPLNLSEYLLIDDTTERNLEIFSCLNGQKGKGTLRFVLDETVTPMGGRLLSERLHHPFRRAEDIESVQEAVSFFFENNSLREHLREVLKQIYDIERISQRISLNRYLPRDLVALRASLALLPHVLACLTDTADPPPFLTRFLDAWEDFSDISFLLEHALVDDPPSTITDGGLIRYGYHEDLDNLIDLVEHGEQRLNSLLEKEKAKNALPKLKMGYNRVFGYYYELSRAKDGNAVPPHFIRRQSLANAERFTTEELKKLEDDLLQASDKRKSLEYRLFVELREKIAACRTRFHLCAASLALLDYWQCLAHVGREKNWCMPLLAVEPVLTIEAGRHPVVESAIGLQNFVPNDLSLVNGRTFCLLTGPNMAGKSTILRQSALIILLAHMGSMVPAKKAVIGLCDRIFSRVGASDNLSQGQSTFMVEMMETARILRQATKESFVILDEIGRGTSTYDGVALAWAIAEYLVKRNNGSTRTIFATHYHELTELEGLLPEVFTMNVAIREFKNDIVFLHKLIPGSSDRSYGVDVARLAGIPAQVVERARALLPRLEIGKKDVRDNVRKIANLPLPGCLPKKERPPESDHPLLHALKSLNPEQLSPIEALNLLIDWKKRWAGKENE